MIKAIDWAMRPDWFGAGFTAKLTAETRRHWRLVAGGALLLVAAAAGAALLLGSHSGRSAAVVAPYPHELSQVSFAVAGDVIPHEPVRALPVGARSSPA